VKRKIGYSWQLRDVMAQNRIYTATELVPMLHDRGISLSASQVHRLVSGTPERLSLQVLSALCVEQDEQWRHAGKAAAGQGCWVCHVCNLVNGRSARCRSGSGSSSPGVP
jgi:Cro/C1-type HTH DNA-binding domain